MKSHKPHSLVQINDKTFIDKGEIVSFEKDTPILRMRQQMEDDKHFREYERERLDIERDRISGDWIKTSTAIIRNPELKKCITEEGLISISDEYEKYVDRCTKLKMQDYIQSKEEFLVREQNMWCCCGFPEMLIIKGSCYHIHNPETARYTEGNMREKMSKEFEAKWY